MSGHTPGPWLASSAPWPKGPGASIEIHSKDGDWIGSIHGDHAIVDGAPVRGFPSNDSGESNARLIAAAPDLLAALEGIADHLYWIEDEGPPGMGWKSKEVSTAVEAVEAAIARARGVQL